MCVVLDSFQGSRAVLDLHYGENRHARLELDQLDDRYPGQRTEERAKEEMTELAHELRAWLTEPNSRIEEV